MSFPLKQQRTFFFYFSFPLIFEITLCRAFLVSLLKLVYYHFLLPKAHPPKQKEVTPYIHNIHPRTQKHPSVYLFKYFHSKLHYFFLRVKYHFLFFLFHEQFSLD